MDSEIISKIIGQTVSSIYSRFGCTVSLGENVKRRHGIRFEREIIILCKKGPHIRLTCTEVHDFYFNYILGKVSIEEKPYKENHLSDKENDRPVSNSSMRFSPAFGPITKIYIMGFDINRLTDARKVFEHFKTTQDTFLIETDNPNSKLLISSEINDSIYITANIHEIEDRIKSMGLIVEKVVS